MNKPRIRCLHYQPHLSVTYKNTFLLVQGLITPLTWIDVITLALGGDAARRWPNLAKPVQAAITL